jgi:hypothetical protein
MSSKGRANSLSIACGKRDESSARSGEAFHRRAVDFSRLWIRVRGLAAEGEDFAGLHADPRWQRLFGPSR